MLVFSNWYQALTADLAIPHPFTPTPPSVPINAQTYPHLAPRWTFPGADWRWELEILGGDRILHVAALPTLLLV